MNLLLSRLLLVKSRIDDTEDLINIELDQRCALWPAFLRRLLPFLALAFHLR